MSNDLLKAGAIGYLVVNHLILVRNKVNSKLKTNLHFWSEVQDKRYQTEEDNSIYRERKNLSFRSKNVRPYSWDYAQIHIIYGITVVNQRGLTSLSPLYYLNQLKSHPYLQTHRSTPQTNKLLDFPPKRDQFTITAFSYKNSDLYNWLPNNPTD